MEFRFRNIAIAALSVILLAGNALSQSVAKYAGEFLSIGVGGRALGLGGAYAALANDVTAGYWNPAGLSQINYPQFTLMHDERFAGLINYDYGAAAIPVGTNSSLGFSVIRMGVDNIANTSNAGVDVNGNALPPGQLGNLDHIDSSKVTYFNDADWAFFISYAKKTSDEFSYGANVKIIRRQLGDASATGIGFDLGAQYRLSDRLALGANFQDITTTLVAWSTGTNELISPTLKLGSAYFIDAFGGRIAPAFDVDLRGENRETASNYHVGAISMDFHTGLEYDIHDAVALRTGWSDIGSLNLGAGVHLPKFDIDYSFAKFDGTENLGNTHRISLTFTFQAEQFARTGVQ
ncbi:MAG TPA: PorV/PorQ family protein [Bacteroidota bacterium]|nr:PorV/PorQ family protein [Bacteroidota bacterium]